MQTPDVTILLPAFDEEKSIRNVIEDIRSSLAGAPFPYEILVVNDGSTDETAEIAVGAGARVFSHQQRRGAGAAIKTGILEAQGENILLMDADGSYPAHAIPRMLAELARFRQVVGARKVEAGTVPWLRAFVKYLLRKLGEFFVRQPIPDINSGMRAFGRQDALAFFHLLPDSHSCVSTLTLCFIGMGVPVSFVPIDYLPRVGKSKFHVITDTFRFFVQILRSVTYFAPLRVFLSTSLILFLLATGKSAFDIYRRWDLEESDVILYTFSAVTAVLGLLADLIARQLRKTLIDDLFRRPVRVRNERGPGSSGLSDTPGK
ncbi:MAG: glycosyltransferase family 2 protein [Deltaproteobacteria bacterium]|nr:glycosyltransferase family 2 protein [Deltaproteobacteria bacterium]